MQKDLDRLIKLFEGFASAHGTHGEPTQEGLKWIIKPTAKTLREPVTKEMWQEHIEGKRPLGVMPIREDSTCSWGSIDIDEYDIDITEIVTKVYAAKMPLVPCRSKSGGLHLFVFFEQPYQAAEVQDVLSDVAASLGLSGSEIFPKQTKMNMQRGDLPSWIIMPYFGGTYNDKLKLQHGLKKSGTDMSLGEFVKHAEEMKCSVDALSRLCTARRSSSVKLNGKKAPPRQRGKSPCDFTDGPPCLEYLSESGLQNEARKRCLFMEANYLKRADPEEWKSKVEAMNQRFNPPLPSSEVQGVINSIEKKDYHYECKKEPFVSHCNSRLCRKRKFGVGSGGELEPVFTSIKRIGYEVPLWIVTIENVTLELTTHELQTYKLFHQACMANKLVFPPMRDPAWYALLNEAMTKVEDEDPPPDAAPGSEFLEQLTTFLTNRAPGERKADLLSDRSWEDVENGRWWFTLSSLEKYLKNERITKFGSRYRIVEAIKKLKGVKDQYNQTNKKGGYVKCWHVPSSIIEKIEPLETPKRKRDVI